MNQLVASAVISKLHAKNKKVYVVHDERHGNHSISKTYVYSNKDSAEKKLSKLKNKLRLCYKRHLYYVEKELCSDTYDD